jgi:hypothetical protein
MLNQAAKQDGKDLLSAHPIDKKPKQDLEVSL